MTQKSSSSRQGTALILFATLLAGSAAVAALGGYFFIAAPGSSAQNGIRAAAPAPGGNAAVLASDCQLAAAVDGSVPEVSNSMCAYANQTQTSQPQAFAPQTSVAPIQQPSCQQLSIAQNDDEYAGPFTQNCAPEAIGANNTQAASSGSGDVIS